MIYIQKLFDDSGLLANRRCCGDCKFAFDIIYPDQNNKLWPLGAQCDTCRNIIWFSSVDSRILKIQNERPAHIPGFGPSYMAWINEEDKRFFDSLPPCPECDSKRFFRLVEPGEARKSVNCPQCKNVINPLENPPEDVSQEYRSTKVWYLIEKSLP